jgi:hypothetical protein
MGFWCALQPEIAIFMERRSLTLMRHPSRTGGISWEWTCRGTNRVLEVETRQCRVSTCVTMARQTLFRSAQD